MFECFGCLRLVGCQDDDDDAAWYERVGATFEQCLSLYGDIFSFEDLSWKNAEALVRVFLVKNRHVDQIEKVNAAIAFLRAQGLEVVPLLMRRDITDDGRVTTSLLEEGLVGAAAPRDEVHGLN